MIYVHTIFLFYIEILVYWIWIKCLRRSYYSVRISFSTCFKLFSQRIVSLDMLYEIFVFDVVVQFYFYNCITICWHIERHDSIYAVNPCSCIVLNTFIRKLCVKLCLHCCWRGGGPMCFIDTYILTTNILKRYFHNHTNTTAIVLSSINVRCYYWGMITFR